MKTIEQILKIKAVVLYILKAFPEGVDYIHLFKVMYFAQQDQLKEYCLIREKVVTFRMVKLNMLLSIFLITK